jgi:hypothetical protein
MRGKKEKKKKERREITIHTYYSGFFTISS